LRDRALTTTTRRVGEAAGTYFGDLLLELLPVHQSVQIAVDALQQSPQLARLELRVATHSLAAWDPGDDSAGDDEPIDRSSPRVS
jgi:hypothetical protein